MKVQCIANSLTEVQREKCKLGRLNPRYQLTTGRLYTVLGLGFSCDPRYGHGVTVSIKDDAGRHIFTQVCLFKILDNRASRFWIARPLEQDSFVLWPQEFFSEFFHENLGDGKSAETTIFHEVVRRLDDEFEDLDRQQE